MQKHDATSIFQLAVAHRIHRCGNYSAPRSEPLQESKYGITLRRYPGLRIAELTPGVSEQLYRDHFWIPYRCHELPPALGVLLFLFVTSAEMTPLMLAATEVRLLQSVLLVPATSWIDDATVAAARPLSDSPRLGALVSRYLALRADFFRDVLSADGRKLPHALGWYEELCEAHALVVREGWCG